MISIDQATALVLEYHALQHRDEGLPYAIHPIRVALMVAVKGYDEEHILVALLHDLVEDTTMTIEKVRELTNDRVANAVYALTKPTPHGVDKDLYYGGIRNDPIARVVKVADKMHNLSTMSCWKKARQVDYIEVAEKYVAPLAKGTPFEADFQAVILNARKRLNITEA